MRGLYIDHWAWLGGGRDDVSGQDRHPTAQLGSNSAIIIASGTQERDQQVVRRDEVSRCMYVGCWRIDGLGRELIYRWMHTTRKECTAQAG